jgi:branched-chain amino acid transport system ATP-binding protein
MAEPALVCENLCAGWGDTIVLPGLSVALPAGAVLAILGRNGVGKSTLLSAIMGRANRRGGSIRLHGEPIEHLPVYGRAKRGLGFVPQEREIFANLSVRENLLVATAAPRGVAPATPWTLDRVLALFPRLGERLRHRGDQLSGGEQQMLSIARALMGNPTVVLLDEPMEGLAPIVIDQLLAALHALKAQAGLAIVLVEQHADLALELTDRVLVLDRGVVVYDHADGGGAPDAALIKALSGLPGEDGFEA